MENEENKPRVAVVRKVALDLLNEIGIKSAPVYMRDILKHLKTLGVGIEFYELDFGEGRKGIQVTDLGAENDLIIAVNKNQHEHSKRFTIGHELGHYFLKHNRHRHEHSIDIFEKSKKTRDPLEIEANQFAAELLMPTYILKEDLKNNVGDIQALATKYNVSKLAMGWKISKTAGLLNKIC